MTTTNKLLSVNEAATFLGVKPQTLYHWQCTGRYNIPSVKIGKLLKYRQSDLDAFVEKCMEHNETK